MTAARSVSMRASRSGLPISAVMSCAICSARISIAAAAFVKNAARAGAGSAAHAGNASRAAEIAVLASSASDAGYTPATCEGRQGFRFSYVSPLALSRHSPPT
jgi:hypothetical protein